MPSESSRRLTLAAFSFATGRELRALLASSAAADSAASVGCAVAELYLRGVFALSALGSAFVDTPLPPALVCAFLTHAGAHLHPRHPELIAALVAHIAEASPHQSGSAAHACRQLLELERMGWKPRSSVSDSTATARRGGGSTHVECEAAGAGTSTTQRGSHGCSRLAADERFVGSAGSGPQTLATARFAAAAELGLVLVPRDTPPERLRGLREGWVYWYAGSPVVHPETGRKFLFEPERGRFVESSIKLADP